MANIIARESMQVELNGSNYTITALDAAYGLTVLGQLEAYAKTGGMPSGAFIKDLVVKSVSLNNIQMTEKKFDLHFSRKYKELLDLFKEITDFNFEGMTDPNEGSDTTE